MLGKERASISRDSTGRDPCMSHEEAASVRKRMQDARDSEGTTDGLY